MRHQGAKFWPIECDDRYRDILQAHYITSAIYGCLQGHGTQLLLEFLSVWLFR